MTVSPTARRDLYAGFMMMDINKDGSLNSAELMLGFQELMGMTLPQSWAKQLMTEIGQVDGQQLPSDIAGRIAGQIRDALDQQVMGENQIAAERGRQHRCVVRQPARERAHPPVAGGRREQAQGRKVIWLLRSIGSVDGLGGG